MKQLSLKFLAALSDFIIGSFQKIINLRDKDSCIQEIILIIIWFLLLFGAIIGVLYIGVYVLPYVEVQ